VKLHVKTTFDFGKLARKMPDILKHLGNVGAKSLAANARSMIKDGKLKNVTEGTMEIAKKGWSRKRTGARRGTKQQALLHSGSALASIKAIDNEVHAAGYLEHHMDEYIIVANAWTRQFTPYIVGKPVPERNPFFTKAGNLRKPVKERMTAHKKGIYQLIGKHLKKHGR
tara:strand:- start:1485 stop:1991 length:507 start_codon:yes stop_codon:yes gene_type:complete